MNFKMNLLLTFKTQFNTKFHTEAKLQLRKHEQENGTRLGFKIHKQKFLHAIR